MVIDFSSKQLISKKAKGRISKWVFQENKACQIFRKTNISYPLIRTRTCAYQGVRNVSFLENLACFVFLKYPFWDSPFCLIIDELIVTFLSISSPPWTKSDGLYLPDKTFPDIMTLPYNVCQIYPLNSHEMCLSTTRPICPGIFAEPEIANLS